MGLIWSDLLTRMASSESGLTERRSTIAQFPGLQPHILMEGFFPFLSFSLSFSFSFFLFFLFLFPFSLFSSFPISHSHFPTQHCLALKASTSLLQIISPRLFPFCNCSSGWQAREASQDTTTPQGADSPFCNQKGILITLLAQK